MKLIMTNNTRANKDRVWELMNEYATANGWVVIFAVELERLGLPYHKVICEKQGQANSDATFRYFDERFLVSYFNGTGFVESKYDLTLERAVEEFYKG